MKIIKTAEIKTYSECLSLKIDKDFTNIYTGNADKTFTKISFTQTSDLTRLTEMSGYPKINISNSLTGSIQGIDTSTQKKNTATLERNILTEETKLEILNDFTKSVKNVVYSTNEKDEFFGCVSYDGSGIIYKNKQKFDTIEGPETEIKHISFNDTCTLISLSTRGSSVWILNVNDTNLEIETILDEHTQDVKGTKFNKNVLYTFGYDETIKVYSHLKGYDDSLTLINNISLKALEYQVDEKYIEKILIFDNFTVWDMIFFDEFIVAAVNTELFLFDLEMNFKYKERVSDFPIYEMVKINKEMFFIIYNENSVKCLAIEGEVFKCKQVFENVCLRINSIDFCYRFGVLVVGGEELCLKLLQLEFD
ncbi:putative cytosolic iron-sulfur protein assembly protein Ciao1 [Cucumispora dikerogammari]|nr:putative cytosolic iron-sulfur protein assembly protein Ciao1 [Cucumispora dikerogammari]